MNTPTIIAHAVVGFLHDSVISALGNGILAAVAWGITGSPGVTQVVFAIGFGLGTTRNLYRSLYGALVLWEETRQACARCEEDPGTYCGLDCWREAQR